VGLPKRPVDVLDVLVDLEADRAVEGAVLGRDGADVAPDELDAVAACAAGPGEPEHALARVEGEDPAAGSHGPRRGPG
jgi:hypothetical protein